jgi:hypothetical protein
MMTIATAVLLLLVQTEATPESWRETSTESGPLLSYGEAAEASIRFRCVRPGMLRADLASIYTGEGPQPRTVTIQAARTRASYRLSDGADDEGRFSVEIPQSAPVMAAFRRSGALSLRAGRWHMTVRATSTLEIQAIAGFLRRCRD